MTTGSSHQIFVTQCVEGSVVGRYRYVSVGPNSAQKRLLVAALRKSASTFAILPLDWSTAKVQELKLPSRMEFQPSKLKDQRRKRLALSFKKHRVEYFRYFPFDLKVVDYSISTYTQCFRDIWKGVMEYSSSDLIYLDFHAKNILSLNGLSEWKCCDYDSFVVCKEGEMVRIAPDLCYTKPQAPEWEVVQTNCSKEKLMALSVWQIGVMFFSLMTKGMVYDPSSAAVEEESKDADVEPFNPLCPIFEPTTMNMATFTKLYREHDLAKWVHVCLTADFVSRVKLFSSLSLSST